MVIITSKKKDILIHLGQYVFDRTVFNELNEPIIYDESDVYFFHYIDNNLAGFLAVNLNSKKLKYIYSIKRRSGVATRLINEMKYFLYSKKIYEVGLIANKSAMPFYESIGYTSIKEFKNYHKIKIDLK